MSVLTIWARVLVDSLALAGVRDVVVSPGSRSTPFVLAAARHPELRLHDVIDERAAGFFALGLARLGGPPPVLLCTSGSAAAHYYPAVVEASLSRLPLVALTADRPSELHDCGAPQTVDQTRLFGEHARFFADLGAPDEAALAGLRRTVANAILCSQYPSPGPIQINTRARKPLEPRSPATDAERALDAQAQLLLQRSLVVRAPIAMPDPIGIDETLARVRLARRPALVAGPAGLEASAWREPVLALCRRAGLALLAETTSQLRQCGEREGVVCADAFDLWLRPGKLAPDLVLELGSTPTSSAYARWLAASAPTRIVLGGESLRDPDASASLFVLGDTLHIATSLSERAEALERDPSWAARVRDAEERAWGIVEQALERAPTSEGAMTRALVRALPRGALLAVGNSLPVRHVDRFARGGQADVRVLSQRGANGIDGWIASTSASASRDGAPTALLIGDVTLAHDVGSLALAARVKTPLAIVVLDNDGGRIFDQLPLGGSPLNERERALFTTPPGLELAGLARAFGLAHAEAHDDDELDRSLRLALSQPRATLIRAVVPPEGAALLEQQLREAMHHA